MLEWLKKLQEQNEDNDALALQKFQESLAAGDSEEEAMIAANDPDEQMDIPEATSPDANPNASIIDYLGKIRESKVEDIKENEKTSPLLYPSMIDKQPVAEKIASTAKPTPVTPKPTEDITPEEVKQEEDVKVDSLVEALKVRNDQNYLLNMIRAGDTVSRAISGAGKPIEIEHLYGQNKPVEDELLKRKAAREQHADTETLEGDNPSSQISQDLRERQALLFEQVGMGTMAAKIRNSNLSYNRLQKMMGVDSNIIATKQSADARKLAAQELSKSKEERSEEKKQDKATDFINTSINNLKKDKVIESFEKIKMENEQAASALANPSGPGDIQTLYNFIKFLDQQSAVREGEVGLATSVIPIRDRIRNYMSKFTSKSPQILGPQMRADIKNLSDAVLEQHRKAAEKRISIQKQLAKKKGVTDDDLYIYDQFSDTSPSVAPTSDRASKAAEELKRRGIN